MNNKNIKTMVIAGLACAALCGTTLAAPRGGNGGRAPQKAPAHQQAPRQAQPARGPGGGHTAKAAPVQHRAAPAKPARAAAKPAPHKAPPARHEVTRHEPPRPAGHVAPPPRPHDTARHHWTRPVCPPPRADALRAWTWVDAAWDMIIDGVCCYGDGYYYDGYNYYYNGAYYTTPPMVTTIITQPAVACW